jgi:hypothetical protein
MGTTCFPDYYESLSRAAFTSAFGFAMAQLGLTLVLSVLGVVVYLSWKKWEKERAAMKDWKALVAAAVLPIVLVSGARFLWNASVIVIERQQRSDQSVGDLTKEIQTLRQEKTDRAQKLAGVIDRIESSNYPQQLLDAKAVADDATTRKLQTEADYDQCRKQNPQAQQCYGLFNHMGAAQFEEAQKKARFGQVAADLNTQLNTLRNP